MSGPHHGVWDRLPEEVAVCILRWCAAKDLGQLSAVDRRFRRLSLDERLWEALYTRAVPPCVESESRSCLFASGIRVADVDITEAVERALDRLLDPAVAAVCPEPDLPQALCALADIRPRLNGCRHHWPTVIAARGYRWALAVSATVAPRLFGPHLDGSPPTLVGCVRRANDWYHGDLGDGVDGVYHLHGHGTIKREYEWLSGRWDGKTSVGSIMACRLDGVYYGDYYGRCRQGRGVFVERTDTAFGPPAIHGGRWNRGLHESGNRGWRTEYDAHGGSITGSGHTLLATGYSQGIIRAGHDGRIAFCGEMVRRWTRGHITWRPHRGRLFRADASVLYEGDLGGIPPNARSGRIHTRDRCTLDIAKWYGGRWEPQAGRPPQTTNARAIVLTYPNGDRMTWAGDTFAPDAFVCTNGRTYRPSLGWNVTVHPTEDAWPLPESCRILLQDTIMRLPDDAIVVERHSGVGDIVFWPRASSPADVADALDFVDHMARHHGPSWVKCRAAVRLFYDRAVVAD